MLCGAALLVEVIRQDGGVATPESQSPRRPPPAVAASSLRGRARRLCPGPRWGGGVRQDKLPVRVQYLQCSLRGLGGERAVSLPVVRPAGPSRRVYARRSVQIRTGECTCTGACSSPSTACTCTPTPARVASPGAPQPRSAPGLSKMVEVCMVTLDLGRQE